MHVRHNVPLMAALALCALPVLTRAGEAPVASAPSQQETEKRLAAARQRLEAAAREVGELSGQLGRRFNVQLGNEPGDGPPPRALLGVSIGPGADKDGAHVMDVSPGGPAAEAGIKVGDIITGIAGLELTKDSNPGRALVEKMSQLEPEQKVKVVVLREGKKLNFDVAPRRAPQDVLIRRQEFAFGRGGNPGPETRARVRPFNSPGVPGEPGQPGPGGPQGGPNPEPMPNSIANQVLNQVLELRARQQQGGRLVDESEERFDGAELASLSERLGSYFGVKTGVLVVRAGVNSAFKLQDGDVILAIDGRETLTAQQAGRILRSYQPGEKLTLRVQRDRKVQNIESTAPGGRRPN
ncbi:MAG: PDZ domain-containing protein [Steroidobacteraceae bacterium]